MHSPIPFLAPPGGLMQGRNKTHEPTTSPGDRLESFHEMSPQTAHIRPLLEEIRRKHGDALLAILVYGSWLRGKRDTMLDFYVLVEDYHTLDSFWQGWMCKLLPPNVYQIHHQTLDDNGKKHELRAKVALLTFDHFRNAIQHDFHSYFWARFAQPCEVLYARNEAVSASLQNTFERSSARFMEQVIPAMNDTFSSCELWTHGLSLTYQCELRTESRNRGETLYDFSADYFDRVAICFARNKKPLSYSESEEVFLNCSSLAARRLSPVRWWLRRLQGKLLSMLRLFKAAFTFNQPLEYLLWKIERHSGLYVQPSRRQLKHPLLFAWPLLWKLYRQGAFR